METAVGEVNKMTHVSELNATAKAQIAQALKDGNHPQVDLTPPHQQPVLTAESAKAVGAVNVGHEETSDFQEDLGIHQRNFRDNFKSLLKPFFGGNEKRAGLGRIWDKVKSVRERSRLKKGDKVDSSQEID